MKVDFKEVLEKVEGAIWSFADRAGKFVFGPDSRPRTREINLAAVDLGDRIRAEQALDVINQMAPANKDIINNPLDAEFLMDGASPMPIDECIQMAQQICAEISPEIAERFQEIIDNKKLFRTNESFQKNVKSARGTEAQGGYVPDHDAVFIQPTGTVDDVAVLVHEMTHATFYQPFQSVFGEVLPFLTEIVAADKIKERGFQVGVADGVLVNIVNNDRIKNYAIYETIRMAAASGVDLADYHSKETLDQKYQKVKTAEGPHYQEPFLQGCKEILQCKGEGSIENCIEHNIGVLLAVDLAEKFKCGAVTLDQIDGCCWDNSMLETMKIDVGALPKKMRGFDAQVAASKAAFNSASKSAETTVESGK